MPPILPRLMPQLAQSQAETRPLQSPAWQPPGAVPVGPYQFPGQSAERIQRALVGLVGHLESRLELAARRAARLVSAGPARQRTLLLVLAALRQMRRAETLEPVVHLPSWLAQAGPRPGLALPLAELVVWRA